MSDGKGFFETNDITNKEIGGRIKKYSKAFYILGYVCSWIVLITFLVFGFKIADERGAVGYVYFLIGGIIFFLSIVSCYFTFLISSGFGAIVEDIATIKENSKGDKKVNSTKKFEDLPKL